ncbi:MAG: sugar O-acyltransferase, partial [Bacteroidota bacterium]|nr:sugar O-acyltransferase [Bacteroidota bacterium]
MSKKVIIIGGEGNGGIIAACIEDNRNKYNDTEYEIAGFLNDYLSADDKILGYPVMGKIADIDKYISEGYYFMYAILIIGKGKLRESIYDKINIPKKQLATIIHKSAFIGIGAKIEPGVLVM